VNAYIKEHFRVHLTKHTIHELLKRDARVKSCRGIPMEDRRTEVTPEEISGFLEVRAYLKGCADMLYDLDPNQVSEFQ
jgi:hypothetical protein